MRSIDTARLNHAFLSRRWAVLTGQLLFGVLIVAIWQGAVSAGIVKSFVLAPPWSVVSQASAWFANGTIWTQIGSTLEVAGLGFVIGTVVGTSLGLAAGIVPAFRYFLSPFLGFFNSVPPLIIIPIFVLWFGFGNKPQVIVVTLGLIFLNAAVIEGAVSDIQGVLVLQARALGASRWQMIKTVYIPGIGVWMVTLGRQNVAHSIVGATVVEFFGSRSGLGYLIENSLDRYDTRGIYAAIFIASAIAYLFDTVMRRIDRRVSRYIPPR
jgi:NitT/TauT family transport system permease protein